MAEMSTRPLISSISLLDNFDPKIAQEILDAEDKVDAYEDALGSYLVKLSSKDMDEADSHEVTKLLHMIGDLERISDHSVNLVESAEELKDKGIVFSEYAVQELSVMCGAVIEIVTITENSFKNLDLNAAVQVEPLEQVVDYIKDQIKLQHVIRVQKNQCTIEHGFILSDILTNLERVSDHCSNIAGCLIEMSRHDSLDLHNYLHEVRASDKEYADLYKQYMKKYAL
jgi:phosphate:Na+ symporter